MMNKFWLLESNILVFCLSGFLLTFLSLKCKRSVRSFVQLPETIAYVRGVHDSSHTERKY